MANKIRFDRKSIEDAAFAIVQTRGIAALNARSLAYEINASTQPIFSNFSSMEEIKEIVFNRCIEVFRQFSDAGLVEKNPVKGLALAMVKFVNENRYLYQVLFHRSSNLLKAEIEHFGTVLTSYIAKSFSLPNKVANIVFLENWLFIVGLSSQSYSGALQMNEKALSGMLDSILEGTVNSVKARLSKR